MAFPLIRLLVMLALSAAVYWATLRFEARLKGKARMAAYAVSGVVTFFWLLFDLLLFRIFSSAWLIELRAIPAMEFTIPATGVLGALLKKRMEAKKPPKDWVSRNNGLLLAWLIVIAAFIDPVLFPFEDNFVDEWKDGVCLQSNGYTCGPATVATMLHHFGIETTEEAVARRIALSQHGSASWDLMRELRRNGLRTREVSVDQPPDTLPVPCIVSVRLGDEKGINHVVVAYEQTDDTFTFGDPLAGRFEWSKEFTYKNYWFAGDAIQVLGRGK